MTRLLVLAMLLATVSAAEPAKPVILVTAFGPFGDRGINGSATLAKALDGTEINGTMVRVLIMPVRWGETGRAIPPKVAELDPILILGLGEGYTDHISIEMVGRNEAKPIADIDGKKPAAAKLDAAGPAQRPARFRWDAAWIAKPPMRISTSEDAGGYLCNEALWTITGTAVTAAGFVHVPPQGKVPDKEYGASYLPVVIELIRHNLPTVK